MTLKFRLLLCSGVLISSAVLLTGCSQGSGFGAQSGIRTSEDNVAAVTINGETKNFAVTLNTADEVSCVANPKIIYGGKPLSLNAIHISFAKATSEGGSSFFMSIMNYSPDVAAYNINSSETPAEWGGDVQFYTGNGGKHYNVADASNTAGAHISPSLCDVNLQTQDAKISGNYSCKHLVEYGSFPARYVDAGGSFNCTLSSE